MWGPGKDLLRLMCSMMLPFAAYAAPGAEGQAFHLDSRAGDDANDGLSPATAWRTLEKASSRTYQSGERLLLRKGCVFQGKLLLRASGSAQQPVIVEAYDGADRNASLPVIDAKGFLAGAQLVDCEHVEVSHLEITADAGEPKEPEAGPKRFGVLVSASAGAERRHIHLRSLRIHDIFATTQVALKGKNATSNKAVGIEFTSEGGDGAFLSDILIEGCEIERTGFTGIGIHSSNQDPARYHNGIRILNNTLRDIGGPGIQPGGCRNVLVRANLVDRSGSSVDERMHGRGSGIWPWTCNDMLIERNAFLHARGKADSCGAHIDFNCSNVVVQHNLSLDNEGGFVEILGNCRNCSYRYNVSINDGFRVKGKNGAQQEGKTLWLSSYTGRGNKRTGPFNSYIYNNTVFVKADIRAAFSAAPTTDGALVANNIFCIQGQTANVGDDQEKGRKLDGPAIRNVIWSNNIITAELPGGVFTENSNAIADDPKFRNAGGLDPADYAPTNPAAVKGRGVAISKLPGDETGIAIGLEVETDYFGNRIAEGPPDLGAIVFGGKTTGLPPIGAAGMR